MIMNSHINRLGKAKFGIVSAVDAENGLVKVRLQPENCETGWICDAALSVGRAIIYSPSDIGSHVFVETVHGDGDNYVVVSRVFDSTSLPPDFSCLSNGRLAAGQVGIKVSDSEFVIDSNGVNIVGDINVSGNMYISGYASVSKDVTVSGLSFTKHVHGGVKEGASETSPPS